jgi:uncharacterized repeat protein (TIGR01451 family)
MCHSRDRLMKRNGSEFYRLMLVLVLSMALPGMGSGSSRGAIASERAQPADAIQAVSASSVKPYDLGFSTYFGGSSWEHARDVYVDGQGNVYMTGGTASPDFPATPGAYDTTFGVGGTHVGSQGYCDAFVAKFDPSGDLIWATFLGGPNYDRAYGIEVDSQGYVYVAGRAGPGFPVKNAFQPTFRGANQGIYGDQNAFVAKLEPDGSDVVWASYVGTGYMCRDIAIDADGDVYVPLEYLGSINPVLPPTSWFRNAYQSSVKGGSEFGVVKIEGDGPLVSWATWLGGSGNEGATASIRVDAGEYVYAVFNTFSSDLPKMPGVWDQSYNGAADYYVAKLVPDGSDLVFGTYLGGSGDEWVSTHNLALDARGNVYVSTATNSPDFPETRGPHGPVGSSSIGVAKVSATGGLVESVLIGGGGNDNPDGIYVDADSGNVFMTGESGSADFPITPATAYQSAFGGNHDAILLWLSADFANLRYSTYLGGGAYDAGRSGFLGEDGSLYVTGSADGAGWPTVNAYQSAFAGGGWGWGAGDCILAKFEWRDPHKAASVQTPLTGQVVTYTITVQGILAPVTATVFLTDTIPAGLMYATGTLTATAGTIGDGGQPVLTWRGTLSATSAVTLTYAVTVTATSPQVIVNAATIDASGFQTLTRTATVIANPRQVWLPVALRESAP